MILLPLLFAAILPPAQAAIVQRVDDHYNHLASLRCRYTETYAGLGQSRTETGTLLLKKPGRMSWRYDQPPGKVFLLDGKYAFFYTPGDPQATRIPAKKLDDLRSPLRFLLGHTQLTRELDNLQVANGPASPSGPTYRITGVPKGMAQRIHQLALTVNSAGAILSLETEETGRTRTTFTFSDLQENVPTAPADFTFTPPPGVTIIDGSNPI